MRDTATTTLALFVLATGLGAQGDGPFQKIAFDAALEKARSFSANPDLQLRMIKELITQNSDETDLALVQRRAHGPPSFLRHLFPRDEVWRMRLAATGSCAALPPSTAFSHASHKPQRYCPSSSGFPHWSQRSIPKYFTPRP